ncbi:STT3 domain-containing protein [Magnetofaba australis]|uniref:Putative oligosaccharyl transferase STT3 subunit n=1 Tax=Magnetofaba australis IT-1 TaxID=1434232 RepID=A0A1Y2K1L2_9PROT|nr:STT3 domain-containing protein [Magnetofaba australis]OSM01567.1 putative oligosaccharyl transferase STT3 subunit [Magnetofaba australis IT-1]
MALLLGIVAFGVIMRLWDAPHLALPTEQTHLHGEPIIHAADGYYLLDLAQALREGDYPGGLEASGPPLTIPAPTVAPLSAHLLNLLSSALDIPLMRAGFLLPALLGPLLAIPLFLWGRALGGSLWLAAGGALLGMEAPRTFMRSGLGWLDTDPLNGALLLGLALTLFQFVQRRHARALIVALILYWLFLWWWPNAALAVTGALLLFMLAAWRNDRRQWRRLGGAALIALLGATPWLPAPAHLLGETAQLIQLITQSHAADIPPAAAGIAEFFPPDAELLLYGTVGHPLLLGLGAVGAVGLLITRRRAALYLLPWVTLGMWGAVGSQRLLIFTAPLLGFGLAALLEFFWRRWGHASPRGAGVGLAVALLLCAAIEHEHLLRVARAPTFDARELAAWEQVAHHTPPDALIWSWWDIGHALRHMSRRAVAADNHVHDADAGGRLTALARPLYHADPQTAARFMRFYAHNGYAAIDAWRKALNGELAATFALLEQSLRAGPPDAAALLTQAGLDAGEWTPRLFPQTSRPLYLLIRDSLAWNPDAWQRRYATWDFAAQAFGQGKGMVVANVTPQGQSWRGGGWLFDLSRGELQVNGGGAPLSTSVVISARHAPQVKRFGADGPAVMLDAARHRALVLPAAEMDELTRRLFFLNDGGGAFELAHRAPGSYQLWRVIPESDTTHSR